MPPTCHPPTTVLAMPDHVFGVGMFQRPFMERTLGLLKSDTPRVSFGSNQFRLEIAVITESEITAPEAVSIDFCQVKEPFTWKPWLICFVN